MFLLSILAVTLAATPSDAGSAAPGRRQVEITIDNLVAQIDGLGDGRAEAAPGRPGDEAVPEPQDHGVKDFFVELRRVIEDHRAQLRHCDQAALHHSPELAKEVRVSLVVEPSGVARDVVADGQTSGDAALEGCVATRTRQWKFPKLKGNGAARVSYALHFKGSGP